MNSQSGDVLEPIRKFLTLSRRDFSSEEMPFVAGRGKRTPTADGYKQLMRVLFMRRAASPLSLHRVMAPKQHRSDSTNYNGLHLLKPRLF